MGCGSLDFVHFPISLRNFHSFDSRMLDAPPAVADAHWVVRLSESPVIWLPPALQLLGRGEMGETGENDEETCVFGRLRNDFAQGEGATATPTCPSLQHTTPR